MSKRRWRGVVGAAVAFIALCAPPSQARDFSTYRPTASATRISPAEAPKIDGDLSDPVWNKARPIEAFYQLEPEEGAPPSEKTVVRVLYDEDNLYFGIMAYDDGPITARIKQRDGDIDSDDIIRIYLDPDMTRRNAYIFEVNPLGARRDGLIQNNTDVIYEWNTIWQAKTKIMPNGWSVEVKIPFRSISYGSRADWGFDLFRLVRRANERIRWSSINKAIASQDITREGTLTGITGIRKGLGLDVQAFALTRYQQVWDSPHTGTGISFRPSGNIYYKITPSLTGTLTYNTDFSDAPLDQRRVNISRFNLFYPERRDFFLQDAASFEFGGQALSVENDPNAAPFFTRRIGIVNDAPVNILGGVKLSGDYNGIGIGALSVGTARGAGAGEQLLSAARVTMPVLTESKLGLIVTNGNPTGQSHNTVAGGDFQFHDSDMFGGKIVQGDFYFERSFDTKAGQDDSFGFNLNFPNEPWKGWFKFKQVGSNFDPALGFVSRSGIREFVGAVAHRWRFSGSDLRWLEVGSWWDLTTGLDNSVQTFIPFDYWVGGYTEAGDYYMIEVWQDRETVPAFTLPHDIPVPAGTYVFDVVHLRTETAPGRFLSGIEDIQYGGFYGGTLLQTDTTLNVNPDDTFMFSARHTMQQISSPHGNVAIHVESFDTSVNFTPDMQLRGQLQYDNISKDMGLSVRYKWEFQPGAELLVVLGDDATLNGTYYQSHASTFSVRLGKTFRL
ncbi:MAG: carbohydrate binding family 9 domain-containing protein [Alphaproteobacteria bacterium]|nr:carbohydrate binding family 9 domain-containing protein [Alphaproteobacteria bacterium]